MEPRAEVTKLLLQWRNGDKNALDRLVPLVHTELRRAAQRCLRQERPDHTLQPTALVNEVYLRLVDQTVPVCEGRAHFVALAARVMREILVEYARAHCAAKRGGGGPKLSLEEITLVSQERCEEFLDLEHALGELSLCDPRKTQVIELRYFGGLTVEEIAAVVQRSVATVGRDLRFAEAWLRVHMRADS